MNDDGSGSETKRVKQTDKHSSMFSAHGAQQKRSIFGGKCRSEKSANSKDKASNPPNQGPALKKRDIKAAKKESGPCQVIICSGEEPINILVRAVIKAYYKNQPM